MKVHVQLDHDDFLPSYILISEARKYGKWVLHQKDRRLNRSSIVVFECVLNDCRQFGEWAEQGVFFLTRLQGECLLLDIGRTGLSSQFQCPIGPSDSTHWLEGGR